MQVHISAAGPEHAAIIQNLFQLYAYDFSALLGMEVNEEGRFETPSLEAYWTDPQRHPFLIWAGDALAGFALVHQRSRITGDPRVFDMAEFFVLSLHRRRGVGARAAGLLFERFPGWWEVREHALNPAATAFWRKAIAGYTSVPFEDFVQDDSRWHGPVQRFKA